MKVTRALLDLLAERRVFHQLWPGERLKVDDEIYVGPETALEPYIGLHAGNYFPRTMGAFSYSNSKPGPLFDIGRYCSIGPGVSWMVPKHPIEWLSTSPFSYDGVRNRYVGSYLADIGQSAPQPQHDYAEGAPIGVRIGHDVWIGMEAALGDDLTIGSGAVVGARAVVTKDVPPYAIVAGCPAKVIGYRFSEGVIDRLLALQWWRYGPQIVQALDVRDPVGFASRMEDASAGLEEMALTPLTYAEIAAVAA